MRFSFFRALAVLPPAALLLVSAVAADTGPSVRWESLDSLVNNPPGRWGHAALYDALRDRMIVYGGAAGPRDVWTMSLGQPTIWSVLPAQGPGPSTRRRAVCVIDTHRDRLIVFGGNGGSTDVWALPLSPPCVWQRIVPTGPVVASTEQRTLGVYDPVGDRLVVFDAEDSAGAVASMLWQLSLAGTPAWSAFPVASTQPAFRRGADAIYDPLRRRMVIFQGGNHLDVPSGRTVWALDLAGSSGWARLADATTTTHRTDYSAALDVARDRVLIFGGAPVTDYPLPTEAFDLGTGVWTSIGPTNGLRWEHAAIVDLPRDRMIVHGGYLSGTSVEALELTPVPAWKTLGPPVPGDRPPPQAGQSILHDPVRDCLWMIWNGTWRFDLAAPRWHPIASPDPTWRGGVIRDSFRDRLIATRGDFYTTSVWQFDPAMQTWTTLQPIGAPTRGRHSSSYAYDPLRDRLLMFGGLAPSRSRDHPVNDLWALEFSPQLEWVELHPGGTAPLPEGGAPMVYDPVRDRLLLHHSPDELWELPLSGAFEWNLLAQANPGPRAGHPTLYDASRDRLLVLDVPGGDVWALPLGGSALTWEELPQSGEPPLPRFMAAGAIDPTRNQIILFGGWDTDDTFDDTWRLTLGDLVPVSASRERSVGPDPVIEVRDEASGLVPGRRQWLTQETSAIGEIEVEIPAPAFELRLAAASPVEGPVGFEIRLPDASPGRFEVFDVAGRRLAWRSLTAAGDGRVSVRLSSDEMKAPGLCFARVRHGAQERRVRFVRLR